MKLTRQELRRDLQHMISGDSPFFSETKKMKLIAAALLALLDKRKPEPPEQPESESGDA